MYRIEIIGGENARELYACPGENLMQLLQREGITISSPCGGKGFCGKCKVQVLHGKKTAKAHMAPEYDLLSETERRGGFRLACLVNIEEDLVIRLTTVVDEADIMIDGGISEWILDPSVESIRLDLPIPSVEDQRSDELRILDELPGKRISSHRVLTLLPDTLRDNGFHVDVTMFEEDVIDIKPARSDSHLLGLAVDIGTTTIVGYLMDLKSGRQLDVYSALNPQRVYGADVITRTDYTVENRNGLSEMADLVHNELNKMIKVFTDRLGVNPQDIYHLTVAGNTVMMHIFAGISPKNIAVSPFIPAYSQGFTMLARDLHIFVHPEARVSLLPCVAGYIGADTVAAIMSSGMDNKEEISLLVDIGTNGEIALGNRNGIFACSTAAGPAFEGAHIRYGLGGVKGAINKVSIGDKVAYSTIGGVAARGICGSGIVDAVSEMKNQNIIDMMGKIQAETGNEILRSRLREVDGKPAFLIAEQGSGAVEDIYICQKDIREVQLAKGAIAAGIRILMKEMGIGFDEISYVYLAGGFGNYIYYDHACNIGLLPAELRDKIIQIGNGAGAGAKMSLLSRENLQRAESIRKQIRYIELSTRMDFQDLFVDLMLF